MREAEAICFSLSHVCLRGVSYKERKTVYEGSMKSIDDVKKESEEVDISEFMPSGGG